MRAAARRRRPRRGPRATSRSTTTSTSCFFFLSSARRLGERDDLAVDAGAGEALALHLAEQLEVLALAAADDGASTWNRVPSGSWRSRSTICCGVCRPIGSPQLDAVRAARAGVQQAQVVVDLGDGADGRAGVAVRGLLVDGDRGRQALDEVDVRLVHLAEELPGVGAERLHVAALALGEDRVEGQRRLAGPRQAGEHDEGVAREVDPDVLEVVLTCTTDDETVCHAPIVGRAADRTVRAGTPAAAGLARTGTPGPTAPRTAVARGQPVRG